MSSYETDSVSFSKNLQNKKETTNTQVTSVRNAVNLLRIIGKAKRFLRHSTSKFPIYQVLNVNYEQGHHEWQRKQRNRPQRLAHVLARCCECEEIAPEGEKSLERENQEYLKFQIDFSDQPQARRVVSAILQNEILFVQEGVSRRAHRSTTDQTNKFGVTRGLMRAKERIRVCQILRK